MVSVSGTSVKKSCRMVLLQEKGKIRKEDRNESMLAAF